MENNEKVLAKIGNDTITEADLDFMARNINPQMAANFQGEEGRKHLLNELVNQKLFFEDAKGNNMDKEEGFIKELDRVRENLLTQYAIQKLINSVSVTHEELEQYYSQHQDEFMGQENIQASHILVDDLEKANEIYDKIQAGESFEELAMNFSNCPSKAKGGDLGTFGRGQMVPEFEEAAFALDVDQVSKPVETQFGYHIIKTTNKEESRPLSFEEVRSHLLKAMIGEKQNKAYFDEIEKLKEKYPVEIL